MRKDIFLLALLVCVLLWVPTEIVLLDWYNPLSWFSNTQSATPVVTEAQALSEIYKNCLNFAKSRSSEALQMEKSTSCDELVKKYLEAQRDHVQGKGWFNWFK